MQYIEKIKTINEVVQSVNYFGSAATFPDFSKDCYSSYLHMSRQKSPDFYTCWHKYSDNTDELRNGD